MDGFIFFRFYLLQFLVSHNYIFSLFVLIPLDDIITCHFLITMPAVFFILHTLFAVLA